MAIGDFEHLDNQVALTDGILSLTPSVCPSLHLFLLFIFTYFEGILFLSSSLFLHHSIFSSSLFSPILKAFYFCLHLYFSITPSLLPLYFQLFWRHFIFVFIFISPSLHLFFLFIFTYFEGSLFLSSSLFLHHSIYSSFFCICFSYLIAIVFLSYADRNII